MKYEKECQCCGAVFKVILEVDLSERSSEDLESFADDDASDIYPEFCPFCGNHDDEEPTESHVEEDEQ
jgi:hypothetical protein